MDETCQSEKAIYVVYDSNFMTFQKGQIYKDSHKMSRCQEFRAMRVERTKTGDILGWGNYFA